jgi:hypothetical protein
LISEAKEFRAMLEIERINRLALPRTHKGEGQYTGPQRIVREGAMDNDKIPSRFGGKLFYRDGKVEDVS